MPGVKDWLRKATSDLKASHKLSDDEETLDCSAFHTHQCAEKALKAFIVSSQRAIPKTHDLGFLLAHCADIDLEFVVLQDEGKILNPYGNDSRYPNDNFYVDKKCIKNAITMASKVLITVKTKLKIN